VGSVEIAWEARRERRDEARLQTYSRSVEIPLDLGAALLYSLFP
jgi:hypothetical protein